MAMEVMMTGNVPWHDTHTVTEMSEKKKKQWGTYPTISIAYISIYIKWHLWLTYIYMSTIEEHELEYFYSGCILSSANSLRYLQNISTSTHLPS